MSVALALVVVCSTARAVERFPREMRNALDLSYNPPCGVCHMKGNTGVGTAETPLAVSLRARGLQADRSSLGPSLQALEHDSVDSDGDGVGDIAELKLGSDPNTPEQSSLIDRADPNYGCSAETRGCGGARSAIAFASMLSAIAFRRRLRTRKDSTQRQHALVPPRRPR